MTESQLPIVSIVIPTYNQSDFLRQAIDSVMSQTFRDFELIVVDDCSTDTTEVVVKSYTDSRIRYFRTDKNLRPPKSWNYGINLARGRYFSLLPHDDIWDCNFLERMVEQLQENPAKAFAQCNFIVVNESLMQIKSSSGIKEISFYRGIEALEWQLQYLRCNPVALLFDLNKMKNEGLWREDYWDDWAFILRLAFKYGFSYSSDTLAAVRSHSNNLSTILGREGNRLGALYVLDQLFDVFSNTLPHTLESLILFSKELRRLGVSLFFTSIKLILNGDIQEALIAFHMARKINPRIPLDLQILVHLFKKLICLCKTKNKIK